MLVLDPIPIQEPYLQGEVSSVGKEQKEEEGGAPMHSAGEE